MRTAAYQVDEKDILERIFSFFVNRGLENVTIRELSKGTGLVQGTLYYWFGDKTNIICESAEYGLKKVTDEIFDYVFANMNDLRAFFSGCPDEISRYKNELRFIYQMAVSPVCRENRKCSKDFKIPIKKSGFYFFAKKC
ncbi:TetR/AcrR family transcriptional regulator [Qingrenia yutianensis]|uniref:TetR/AcrR family transcriptional regulator n=1 Tax=Qingrenia yutianensis TaxID=2763676 RepID=A0A926FDJ3_9FIRM|nr:TetR/AcrR family transcriptional regulator [Qingrenia yutianensis]MBC8597242.1 TetR/AcrR family transcriptional regulator [Qingrenia yutianensis]